jgi:hypothetical protein
MTRFDVELVLGGPPGDYRTRPTWGESREQAFDDFMRSSSVHDDRRVAHWSLYDDRLEAHWYGNGVSLVVIYNSDGTVLVADSQHVVGGPTPSVLDTWKWRLKRQWHRWFKE